MTWYKKSLPKIKQIQTKIHIVAQTISDMDGVTGVYVWGSYLKQKDDPNAIIRDVDIIAKTDFFSEDLSGIMDDEYSPLKMASASLEDEGFDPKAVKFTKQLLDIHLLPIDHWAISSDNKIMHWGSVVSDKGEWIKMKEDSEKYASFELNMSSKQFKKANNSTKERWLVLADHYVNKYLKDIPEGWYELECNFKEATKHIKKL